MYKIGEFSILSKTTIKTLRYYEKEGLLIPKFIDPNTGYRFYEANQLIELSTIISLRQISTPIKDIKKILNGKSIKDILYKRKTELEKDLDFIDAQLSKINYLLEGENMNNKIILKDLPECTIYYKEGVIEDYSKISEFILKSAEECLELNPNLKCVEPGYCYINYLDGEYKEKNIQIRYAQAVLKSGVENENIKFKKIEPVTAVCIYHKGEYEGLRESYNIILKYIESNNYEIIESPRECYIDGPWNKEDPKEYLAEIQIPVKRSK